MRVALARNAGALIPGLVHNLHNFAHSLSMQMEMWESILVKNPDLPFSAQQRSFQRMTRTCSDFAADCSILSQRSDYSGFEPAFVLLSPALDWIKDFWINFALRSPTALDQGIDPWQAGSSTKPGHLGFGLPLLRIGCREMGWTCALTGDARATTLSFAVPRAGAARLWHILHVLKLIMQGGMKLVGLAWSNAGDGLELFGCCLKHVLKGSEFIP